MIESCGSHRGMAAQQQVTWLKEERAQWSLFLLRNIRVQAGIVWEEQEACNWALYLSETYSLMIYFIRFATTHVATPIKMMPVAEMSSNGYNQSGRKGRKREIH